ncbi:MAG: hypothetical protein KBF42_12110, partial [Chitinophagales bacterium]|nr:hypothetical protein [Chitinophagales bacterium]MBP9796528.1 hypothetical protein [Chitinophagales bacterium]
MKYILFIIASLVFYNSAFSQSKVTGKKDTIEIKSAEYLEIIQKKNVNINRLVNNVVLVQKELTLYCDS